MHVYKFRITIEESDDFLREIEVLSNQTFEDFHNAILKSVNFDGKELASFYICNDKWYRKAEITLLDMTDEEQSIQDEEDDDIRVTKSPRMKRYVMNKSTLLSQIEDPHQHLIYEYDFLNLKTFYILLIKIQPAMPNGSYPICSKSVGDYPKEVSKISLIPEEFEDIYEDSYVGDDEHEPGDEFEEFDDLSLDTDEFGNSLLKNNPEQ
ncbi:MAG: hypothetical protein WCH34_05665 [Bacteroidota bacterium]